MNRSMSAYVLKAELDEARQGQTVKSVAVLCGLSHQSKCLRGTAKGGFDWLLN